MDGLRRAGIDYAAVELPGCDYKIAHAMELGWNYVTSDPEAMDQTRRGVPQSGPSSRITRQWERREADRRSRSRRWQPLAGRRAPTSGPSSAVEVDQRKQ